jgi:hypothetical protein
MQHMKNKEKSTNYGERNKQPTTIYLGATKNIVNAKLSHTSNSIKRKSLLHPPLQPDHLVNVGAYGEHQPHEQLQHQL